MEAHASSTGAVTGPLSPVPTSMDVEGGSTCGATETASPEPMIIETPRSDRSTRTGTRSRTSSPRTPTTPTLSPPVPKKAKRGAKSACGKVECGIPGSDGPTCSACDRSPVLHSNRPCWKHFKDDAAVAAARSTWDDKIGGGASRGLVISNRVPTRQCLCSRGNCMFGLLLKWRKEAAEAAVPRCTICNVSVRKDVRCPGGSLHACRLVFSEFDPKHPTKLPLGTTLKASSPLCMSCYMRGYNYSVRMKAADKLTVRQELAVASAAVTERKSVHGAKHSVRLHVLTKLVEGDFVYLEDGLRVYEKARKTAGVASVTPKSLRNDVITIMGDISNTLSDAEHVNYTAAETGASDGRTASHYIMPQTVPHLQHARLHERALSAENKLAAYEENARRLREEAPVVEGQSQQEKNLEAVKAAALVIRNDIQLHEEWSNAAHGRDYKEDFDVEIPVPRAYIRESFPRSLAVHLTTLCGSGYLLDESDAEDLTAPVVEGGAVEEVEGVCRETPVSSAGAGGGADPGPSLDGTKPSMCRAHSREAVFTYFLGTMIGKSIKGQRYMAPHDLKLSQAFKMRGMSIKCMSLLASIRICCSDSVRASREQTLVPGKDESMFRKCVNFLISVAWDNNDTEPKKSWCSAVHNSQIGASAHQLLVAAKNDLGLESLWTSVKDTTLETLKKGRNPAEHDATISTWNSLLFKILGDNPAYLSTDGEGRSCLEVKIQDNHTAAECKVASKNLFIQAGSTKRLVDNEAALDRIQRCCNAGMEWTKVGDCWTSHVQRRVLVEGDEETYRTMVQLKRGNPEKYKWLLPHPGGWHIMLHVTKALIMRYYGAGIEVVAKALGGDDKHASVGSKYRRSHHFLTVTYEAMWWIVIERYKEAMEQAKGATAAAAVAGTKESTPEGASSPMASQEAVDVEKDVVPWLIKQAEHHKTLKLWTMFLLDDYPTYLAFRTGGRNANYKLCVAAFRKLSPLFAATVKNRYQQLASWHLLNLARMTDDDLEAVGSIFSAQYNSKNYRNFNNVFLDEFMEMINKTVKQNLGNAGIYREAAADLRLSESGCRRGGRHVVPVL